MLLSLPLSYPLVLIFLQKHQKTMYLLFADFVYSKFENICFNYELKDNFFLYLICCWCWQRDCYGNLLRFRLIQIRSTCLHIFAACSYTARITTDKLLQSKNPSYQEFTTMVASAKSRKGTVSNFYFLSTNSPNISQV